MPYFSGRFNNFMLSIRNSLEWSLRRSFIPESIFLKRALSILKPTAASYDSSDITTGYGFDNYYFQLLAAVSEHGFPASEATSALNKLRAFSPLPYVEVTGGSVWDHVSVSVKTHLNSTIDDAVANIESTGRTLSVDDRKYLQLLLTHSSGWSATYPEQMNAHWATFFKTCYPHIKGLVVILDTIAYPEEFRHLPDGRTPERAGLFLLATSESYYVYDCEETLAGAGNGLCRAGQTLEKVYLGMKEWKYMDVDEPWEIDEGLEMRIDYRKYFPRYCRNEDGIYIKYGA